MNFYWTEEMLENGSNGVRHKKLNNKRSRENVITWTCQNCQFDDDRFRYERFQSIPCADWFLYEMIRDTSTGGYALKGVTHQLSFQQYFHGNIPATLEERQLFKICRGYQLCSTLLKRLDTETLCAIVISEHYEPLFWIDAPDIKKKSSNRKNKQRQCHE